MEIKIFTSASVRTTDRSKVQLPCYPVFYKFWKPEHSTLIRNMDDRVDKQRQSL